jgi:hypothetical protein
MAISKSCVQGAGVWRLFAFSFIGRQLTEGRLYKMAERKQSELTIAVSGRVDPSVDQTLELLIKSNIRCERLCHRSTLFSLLP